MLIRSRAAVCEALNGRAAACGGHARCGPAGRELRASAAGRLRPDAVPSGTANSRFRIQDSKLVAVSNLGASPLPGGGCGLRRLHRSRNTK